MENQSMNSQLTELKEDILDIENILPLLKRESANSRIVELLKTLKEKASKLDAFTSKPTPPAANFAENSTQKALDQNLINFTKLHSFAWDQSDTSVSIYVTVNGVHRIPQENIVVQFASAMLDLKIYDCNSRHYRLRISPTFAPIIASKCSYKIKNDRINITLSKESRGHWTTVEKVEAATPKKPEPNLSGDPQESIMQIMKDLYEQGDDEMKRTIAKTWTESQENRMRQDKPF